jgi:hypothetical protein
MIEVKCKDKTYIVEAEDQRSAISKLIEIGIDIVNKERSNIMSSKVISKEVIDNIAESLSRSSFGSGEMIAGILSDPEFQMPVENGVWEISEEQDNDGEYYYYYWKRNDNVMRGPSWQERVSFQIKIDNDTIEFLLGCGVHGASCVFSRRTGDLLEVVPDSLPSDWFWGDGDCPDLSLRARREFLQMTAPVQHA